MRGTLYGSLTSPYARITRIVRELSGASGLIAFEVADPFDEGYRRINPLGKVPALILDTGPQLLETGLIARVLMQLGGTDLLPEDELARIQAEADLALIIGVLDLGVAAFLETRRPQTERSEPWLQRRLKGIETALPLVDAAARRHAGDPDGLAAAAIAVTGDWLSFRLADSIGWRAGAPAAAALADGLLAGEIFAATDPRSA